METILLSPLWVEDLAPGLIRWLQVEIAPKAPDGTVLHVNEAIRIQFYFGGALVGVVVQPGCFVDWGHGCPKEIEDIFSITRPWADLAEPVRDLLRRFRGQYWQERAALEGFRDALFDCLGSGDALPTGIVQAIWFPERCIYYDWNLDWIDRDALEEEPRGPCSVAIHPDGRVVLNDAEDGGSIVPDLQVRTPADLGVLTGGLVQATARSLPSEEAAVRLEGLLQRWRCGNAEQQDEGA